MQTAKQRAPRTQPRQAAPGMPRVRISAHPSYLTRLGVVWASPLRLTIVTELHMREMSATEFYKEFGGGSVGNINGHFQTLAKHGWLRMVREKRAGPGRPHKVYRSTELAVFDDECAAELPFCVRAAWSARILGQMGERVATALRAGAFERSTERLLALDSLLLDEQGWKEAMAAVARCFRSLAQEQTDANLRIKDSEEIPRLMMVSLAGFEAPPAPVSSSRLDPLLERPVRPVVGLDLGALWETRLAKVFSDPLNIQILNEISGTPRSPSELQGKIGGYGVWKFDRQCKALERLGWVARVGEKSGGERRGSTEVFYEAVTPTLSVDLWAAVDPSARKGSDWEVLEAFYERAADAMAAGTLDKRPDKHLSWSPLLLDRIGWRQVLAELKLCRRALRDVEMRMRGRRDGETRGSMQAVFLLAGFEIPSLSAQRIAP
jgi:hypothetical protein